MRLGVIDIGTNSVKLLVANVRGKDILPVYETSRQTRLGQGLYAECLLQDKPIRDTAAAVDELLVLAKRDGCSDTRIIATSAVRESANAGDLLEALGQEVEILSDIDEARLAFRGVLSCPCLCKRQALVVDVGGGSTEFILGDAKGIWYHASLPLGSVRLMEHHPVSDPPVKVELQTVCDSIDTRLGAATLLSLRGHIDAHGASPIILVGTGGMASLFAKMELADDGYDRDRIEAVELSLVQVTAWRERLWHQPLAKRRTISGLPPNRADVALFGSLIYEQVMRQLGFDTLRISTRGIRFGVLQS